MYGDIHLHNLGTDEMVISESLWRLLYSNLYYGEHHLRWALKGDKLYDLTCTVNNYLKSLRYEDGVDRFISEINRQSSIGLSPPVEPGAVFDRDRYNESAKEIFAEFDKLKL
jgi:hypothetical protein